MEKETLYRFFAGSASATEKETIKAWLDEKPANRQRLLEERAFYDAVMLADEKPFADKRRPASTILRLVRQSLQWAAVILLAFTAGYYAFESRQEAFETAANTITVPPGQRVNLSLSDGTKVYLNAGSTFTYPSLFGSDRRKVELNGEAFFEVSANKEKPFVVHTHACDVEVVGTKFNVDAYDQENTFSAALMEGRINVRNNSHPSRVVHLYPNHKVALSDGNLAVSPISDYDIYRWKDGLICFKNLDFIHLMKRIEKYYGIELVIENPSLSRYSFSGTFRISDGIENLLRVLQKDVDYRYTRSEDGNIIYIK